jgi:hypothetical protein
MYGSPLIVTVTNCCGCDRLDGSGGMMSAGLARFTISGLSGFSWEGGTIAGTRCPGRCAGARPTVLGKAPVGRSEFRRAISSRESIVTGDAAAGSAGSKTNGLRACASAAKSRCCAGLLSCLRTVAAKPTARAVAEMSIPVKNDPARESMVVRQPSRRATVPLHTPVALSIHCGTRHGRPAKRMLTRSVSSRGRNRPAPGRGSPASQALWIAGP